MINRWCKFLTDISPRLEGGGNISVVDLPSHSQLVVVSQVVWWVVV